MDTWQVIDDTEAEDNDNHNAQLRDNSRQMVDDAHSGGYELTDACTEGDGDNDTQRIDDVHDLGRSGQGHLVDPVDLEDGELEDGELDDDDDGGAPSTSLISVQKGEAKIEEKSRQWQEAGSGESKE